MIRCVSSLTIWRLAIPLRRKFAHAAAERDRAEPLLVAAELSDGTVGWGETHPRPYVSGETIDSTIRTISQTFLPHVLAVRGARFAEALETIDALPTEDDAGRPCTAARAALELALIDAFSRSLGRPVSELAGWLDTPRLATPGSLRFVRYSGVVGGEDAAGVRRSLRKMRCFGLRDFKLKVGDEGDDARLRAAVAALGKSLVRGATTLRLDANGGWSPRVARERLAAWRGMPIVCVEQPTEPGTERDWIGLSAAGGMPIMADESLVTPGDAERLAAERTATWFNIRLAKNGGMMPALRMALVAAKAGVSVQLGCLVGETSILSAAGRWFLSLVPGVRFAEGSYGRFLLRGDVTRRVERFGYGGRARSPEGLGWGVTVDESLVKRWAVDDPLCIKL